MPCLDPSLFIITGLVSLLSNERIVYPAQPRDEIIHYSLPYLHMHPVVICNTVIIVQDDDESIDSVPS